MILAVRIEQVRRGGGEKGAACSLGRHVLRDADRLATRLLALNLGLRGQRVRVGWPSPPGSQLLEGVHDRIVVEEPSNSGRGFDLTCRGGPASLAPANQ